MRKVFVSVTLSLSASLSACSDREIPTSAKAFYNPVTQKTSVNNTKGGSLTLDTVQELPIGATPLPSASPSAPAGYSFQANVTGTDRDKVTWKLEGGGYKSASLSFGGSLAAANRLGIVSLSGFPSGQSIVTARVTIDSGEVRVEEVKVDLNYSGPSPSPSTSPAPTVDSPTVNAGTTSATVRVGATNANPASSAVRLRVNNGDHYGAVNSDILVPGLSPGQTYGSEAFVTGPGGTSSRQFSFSTMPSGSTDKTVATYWRTANENFTSAVSWSTREWTLDNSSEGGLKVPLNGSQNYNVRIEASNGAVQQSDFSNSFVELRPLPANLAPYQVRVRVGSTDILTVRIEKK